jgi:ABC-2 type transport system ATP-binding protein
MKTGSETYRLSHDARCEKLFDSYGVFVMTAISVSGLKKEYGGIAVVNNLSFDVQDGEIFGFLGPNGAGKTTTLEMIEGLRDPSAGSMTILGKDASIHRTEVNSRIGVQLQSAVLDSRLKVWESICLYASYYGLDVDVDALLAQVNLEDKRNAMQRGLSGGQKQRLNLALALVNDPQVLFLDEPTTGLDPQSRRHLWSIVLSLKERGKTIILTTHYMDEAEKLCDRIAIIDQGTIIAQGSPAELIASLDTGKIIIVPSSEAVHSQHLQSLKTIVKAEHHGGYSHLHCHDVVASIEELLSLREYLSLDELHIRNPTLEDVFIQLTGRDLRE